MDAGRVMVIWITATLLAAALWGLGEIYQFVETNQRMHPLLYDITLSNNVTITDYNCVNVGWADTVLRCDNKTYPNPISYKRVN